MEGWTAGYSADGGWTAVYVCTGSSWARSVTGSVRSTLTEAVEDAHLFELQCTDELVNLLLPCLYSTHVIRTVPTPSMLDRWVPAHPETSASFSNPLYLAKLTPQHVLCLGKSAI